MSTEEGAVRKWLDDLYRPLPGRDPDRVSDDMIAEEMRMFEEL